MYNVHQCTVQKRIKVYIYIIYRNINIEECWDPGLETKQEFLKDSSRVKSSTTDQQCLFDLNLGWKSRSFHEPLVPKFKSLNLSQPPSPRKNPQYRDVIEMNNTGKVLHMFETLEGMLDGGPCLLHQSSNANCHPKREIHLGISGSPCQPYSQKRGSKRWACGGVASHPKHSTSMDSVLAWYTKYEPHASVTEQVMGFKMKTSHEISESPLEQPLVKVDDDD